MSGDVRFDLVPIALVIVLKCIGEPSGSSCTASRQCASQPITAVKPSNAAMTPARRGKCGSPGGAAFFPGANIGQARSLALRIKRAALTFNLPLRAIFKTGWTL